MGFSKEIGSNHPANGIGLDHEKISDEINLPDKSEIISAVLRLEEIVCSFSEEREEGVDSFYISLFELIVYLLSTILNKSSELVGINQDDINSWVNEIFIVAASSMGSAVSHLAKSSRFIHTDALHEIHRDFNLSIDEFSREVLIQLAWWVLFILDEKNHYGSPQFYIYIDHTNGHKFPKSLPRIFDGNKWISGIGGRLLVLPGSFNLSDEESTDLWNQLLIKKRIYDDEELDHSARIGVFEEISHLLPTEEFYLLDLCGGRGDFIEWINKHGIKAKSILIDKANLAVEEATSKGIDAITWNANDPFPINQLRDAVVINFAIQWITVEAFVNTLNVLKPGGVMIANVYPPDLEHVSIFFQVLRGVGFTDLEAHNIHLKNGKSQYILSAKKPYFDLEIKEDG